MDTKIIIILTLFPLMAWLLGLAVRKVLYLSLKSKHVVYSQYEAQFNLTPAEYGYFYEGKIGRAEVLGTLLHMTQRNLLNFDDTNNSFNLTKTTYKQTLTYDFEYNIIAYIRSNGGLSIQDVITNEAGSILANQLDQDVRQLAIKKGYLQSNQVAQLFWKIRNSGTLFSLSYFIIVTASIYYLARNTLIVNGFDSLGLFIMQMAAASIGIVIATLIVLYINFSLYLYFNGVGISWAATKLLTSQWDEILGYRIYLEIVEAPRLIQEIDLNNPNHPYCVALGLINM